MDIIFLTVGTSKEEKSVGRIYLQYKISVQYNFKPCTMCFTGTTFPVIIFNSLCHTPAVFSFKAGGRNKRVGKATRQK
jgi:hypothetical protein